MSNNNPFFVILRVLKCSYLNTFKLIVLGVLFTGEGKPVTTDTGEPIQTLGGEVRGGRGLPESTYHDSTMD